MQKFSEEVAVSSVYEGRSLEINHQLNPYCFPFSYTNGFGENYATTVLIPMSFTKYHCYSCWAIFHQMTIANYTIQNEAYCTDKYVMFSIFTCHDDN